ncbi:ankyrin repeat domain-containing protein SOWAHA [Cyclopterus lumpus]|uniref:ankyrin repeat domain-containing protein SOWAHA n=1 Tax=Cyclopterus lumpus TaxID=8103 RepID=UPI0014869FD0|nr:ankyrin repeat domain-containing protein SOWAHA [Cyclopterus lumpus]
MSGVREQALLDYFYSTGGSSGRVKNADILKTFKPFIGHSDVQLRAKYREEFKLIIDRIAVVKSENGEKYLVLKKKYRQMLHERDAKHPGTDGDGQRRSSPGRAPATVQWDATDASTSSPHQKEQQHEPMSCGEPNAAAEDQQTGTAFMQHDVLQLPAIPTREPSAQSNGEDELDKDSGSKSESEQDDECTGSMGSTAVALDPIEKEWIYSAAGARVPDLSHLLRQDPSLANKKDFTSVIINNYSVLGCFLFILTHFGSRHCDYNHPAQGFTALHWAAKHGNEDMAALVANAGADVNIKSHGGYTPLHIAALHGHRHILDLLIVTYGAKENLRDNSGHFASHYLNIKEPEGSEEDSDLRISVFQVTQAREPNRNRKLASLFHSKKKWGSAEELAPIEEERTASHQLVLPPFRPRKFSR